MEWLNKLLARKIDREVEKEVPVWGKVKAFLNGKKTLVGALILSVPVIVDEVSKILLAGGVSDVEVTRLAGLVLLTVGGLHKAYKQLVAWRILEG